MDTYRPLPGHGKLAAMSFAPPPPQLREESQLEHIKRLRTENTALQQRIAEQRKRIAELEAAYTEMRSYYVQRCGVYTRRSRDAEAACDREAGHGGSHCTTTSEGITVSWT